MKISDLLRHKGSAVVVAAPGDSIRVVLGQLSEHNVGAVVVTDPDAESKKS